MKTTKFYIVIFGISILNSCAVIVGAYDTPMNFNSNDVILIKDTKQCVFSQKIIPTRKIWRDRGKDISSFEVDRLKAMAYRGGGNAISNVRIISRTNPIGYADAYLCSKEIFDNLKSKQEDPEYLKKIITIEDVAN